MQGKTEVVDLALATLLGGGHLLVEDLPGTGKTLLARSIAGASGVRFEGVQCTPDLLPTDITGTSVFRPDSGEWPFRPGPVFANIVLVDVVNRASPRTQSALFQPMEEHQVTVDGATWSLPDPFFCIATQNPFGQVGTFPLPESQLDRFARGPVGRAARPSRRTGDHHRVRWRRRAAVAPPRVDPGRDLVVAIAATTATHCDDKVVEYVLDLTAATRSERLSRAPRPRLVCAWCTLLVVTPWSPDVST